MSTGISGLYKNTKGAKASPKTHNIKILPQYFDAIENGTKTFEIRYNDRDYKVGDLLCLREYRDGAYTGRETVREICYMIDDPMFCKEGYVVLGLKQSEGEWVSVEEKLPEDDDYVLAVATCVPKININYVNAVVAAYFSEKEGFIDVEINEILEGVTHWMPFPELPKARKEDEGK